MGFDIQDHSSAGGKGKEVWTSVGAVGEVLVKKQLKRYASCQVRDRLIDV